jgi:hypothetical protein
LVGFIIIVTLQDEAPQGKTRVIFVEYTSVTEDIFHGINPKITFIIQETPTYENENKTKRQMAARSALQCGQLPDKTSHNIMTVI